MAFGHLCVELEINQADGDGAFVDTLSHQNGHAGFIKEHVFLQEIKVMIFK